MYVYQRLLPQVAVATLLLSGCATRYESRLVEERTERLYGAPQTPARAVQAPAPLRSSDALFERAELESYLAYGLMHSAQLRAAFEAWRAATERVEQASTLPDPRLSFGQFIEEVQTRTGPQERRIGLSQAFPWPGKLNAKADLATRKAEAAWEQVEEERLRVARRIEVAFHEYAFLASELSITRELLGLVQGLEPVVQGRIRSGAGQEDLLRLQVEIGRLEDDVASIEQRRSALSARLADAMNLPLRGAERLLPLPELSTPATSARNTAALVEQALASSPRIAVLERRLEAARSAENLTKYKRRPEFAARVDYIDTGDALDAGAPGSGDDPLFVGLSMSLPVWTSSYSAAEREARHAVRAAHAQLEDARSTLNADIADEVYRIDDAQRRLVLYRESLVPRARESLQLTTAAYRAGTASVLDLLDSERALLEFELSYWRACRAYLQGEARLNELLGGVAQ